MYDVGGKLIGIGSIHVDVQVCVRVIEVRVS